MKPLKIVIVYWASWGRHTKKRRERKPQSCQQTNMLQTKVLQIQVVYSASYRNMSLHCCLTYPRHTTEKLERRVSERVHVRDMEKSEQHPHTNFEWKEHVRQPKWIRIVCRQNSYKKRIHATEIKYKKVSMKDDFIVKSRAEESFIWEKIFRLKINKKGTQTHWFFINSLFTSMCICLLSFPKKRSQPKPKKAGTFPWKVNWNIAKKLKANVHICLFARHVHTKMWIFLPD